MITSYLFHTAPKKMHPNGMAICIIAATSEEAEKVASDLYGPVTLIDAEPRDYFIVCTYRL